ncbi:MAG: hypothetical protein V2I57_10795 [Xanthomonadales bacterium]|jgi:hypothetical protein|nr:hypothetical protein [Xanthomonadales bacterium]
MLKLKKRMNLRVSDRLAVAAALVLTVTALGGVVAEQNLDREIEPVSTRVLKAQASDPQSDDTVERHSAKARLLLFRRG